MYVILKTIFSKYFNWNIMCY